MTSGSRCVLAAVAAVSDLALTGCASSSPSPAASSRASGPGRVHRGQIPRITLVPGQVASAEITGNTASCSSLTKIANFKITVPDQRNPAQLPGTRELCLNTLGITPLQRGNAAGLSL